MASRSGRKSVRTEAKGHKTDTMLDTPLVRGERELFAEAGAVRLDIKRMDEEQNTRVKWQWRTLSQIYIQSLHVPSH